MNKFGQYGFSVPAVVAKTIATPVAPAQSASAPPSEAMRSALASNVQNANSARALRDLKAAELGGFSIDPTVYTFGLPVNSTGVANFRASRQQFEAMAGTREAMNGLIARVGAEQRRDLEVTASTLRLLADGRLEVQGKGRQPLSERAFKSLCSFLTPGGGHYLSECPSELRAVNVNHWAAVEGESDKRRTEAEAIDARNHRRPASDVTRKIQLRTRNVLGENGHADPSNPSRQVWGVVGPRYGAFDADAIAALIRDAAPEGSKAEVIYDGYRGRINVMFHSDIDGSQAVAGEIFKAGVICRFADDGSGSIKISAFVVRNLCLNLIILQHAEEVTMRRRHVGNRKAIVADIQAGIAKALKQVKHFSEAWAPATVESLLSMFGTQDPRAIFTAMVAKKVVSAVGCTGDALVERLMTAFNEEPAYTKAGILNAITRAAHTQEWSSWTVAEDLETAAGNLLFAVDWKLEFAPGTVMADGTVIGNENVSPAGN